MSYTLKNIYTKPNEDLVINFWDDDIVNLIDTYFDAGKIIQKPVKTIEGLTETWTTIFKDKSSFDEFIVDGDSNGNNRTKLTKFCEDNLISWSIEKIET